MPNTGPFRWLWAEAVKMAGGAEWPSPVHYHHRRVSVSGRKQVKQRIQTRALMKSRPTVGKKYDRARGL